MTTSDKGPLIGYMIFETWTEDYSHWSGVISFPDPTGANLAWESPIAMIDKSAYDKLKAEVRRLETNSVHTCHDECPRLACVQRRRIEELEAELEQHAKVDYWRERYMELKAELAKEKMK